MSSWDVAAVAGGSVVAVAVAVAVTVVLARLLVTVASLDRTTRELVRAIDDVRREAVPVGNGGGTNGPAASAVGGRGDGGTAGGAPALISGGSRESGESGGSRGANGANGRLRPRPVDLGLVSPVIKARALGRGTSRAARQLRQRRER